MEFPKHLQLLIGDRGHESTLPAYLESPTWILDKAWDEFQSVARRALDAYMHYCEINHLPHSFLLGLDILVMGEVDPDRRDTIVDIRPTLLEGPCCNSYPACPNLWASRLYGQLKHIGRNPDIVEYPIHPTKILDRICKLFEDVWTTYGDTGRKAVVGVFTRPYELSEEETAHTLTLQALKDAGFEGYRITPDEKPQVKDGKLVVNGTPVDMVWRRIERIHLPGQSNPPHREYKEMKWVRFYEEEFARSVVTDTPGTIFINPWKIDDLRSKTIEERAFRIYESKYPDRKISRPVTLLDDEINSESVKNMSRRGGWVMKRWNSTGGKGIFLHVNNDLVKDIAKKLYLKYDGRHMFLMDSQTMETELRKFDDFNEDTAIQQLRYTDARDLGNNKRLAYDTRINVIYDPVEKKWDFLSGMSRSVPCGPDVPNGNSLLTNVSMGAEISPLIMGHVKPGADRSEIKYGPLLGAMVQGKTELEF
ncbi:hypothetical protein JXA40_01125 [bacterium]|nr:hypothetical protein [candidate division CSSED10-310 bacterium]